MTTMDGGIREYYERKATEAAHLRRAIREIQELAKVDTAYKYDDILRRLDKRLELALYTGD